MIGGLTTRGLVIETVREKFGCRDREAITEPPAPFHTTARGFIGPKLLATIVFDKFAQHIPLNRQSQRFKCEGINLDVSALADQVGVGDEEPTELAPSPGNTGAIFRRPFTIF
jgi:transposase